MARPIKQTIDYFPHSVNHGKTLLIVENEFGNDGYAFLFKLFELLCVSDNQVYDYNNPASWKLLLAKTHVYEDTAINILQLLADLEAIDAGLHRNKIIWSQNLVDNLELVYKRRATGIPEKPVIANKNKVNVSTNRQTKQNNTRQNKTKEDSILIAGKEFNKEWLEALKAEFSDVDFDEQIKKFTDYWTDGNRTLKNPKLALRNWMIKAREIKQKQQPDDDKPIKGLTIK